MTCSILITGAGSGMGLLTARTLMMRGHRVFAGIRDPGGRNRHKADEVARCAEEAGADLDILDLDILDEASCERAAAEVVTKHGRLDVVVHNAAHLYSGASEAFTPGQLLASVDVNAVGAHRLNRAALPVMRAQGAGLLLYNGSAVTRFRCPSRPPNIVGKVALDALAEATAFEVAAFGIETSILMPGVFVDGTSHFASAATPADEATAGVYGDRFRNELQGYEQGFRRLLRGDAPVQGVADEIARIVELQPGARPFRSMVD